MDYNKIKLIIESETLNESIKSTIEQMFSSIKTDDKLKKIIQDEMAWARKVFTKNGKPNRDGVIWYMRYVKFQAILDTTIEDAQAMKYLNKIVQRANSDSISTVKSYANSVNGLLSPTSKQKMEHYLSLNIDGIKNYIFGWKSINDVWTELEEYEEEWASDQDHLIPIEDDESEIIIEAGNDFYWLNLNTSYCSKEASAMGHCGNSPRSHTNDIIYSLRKKVTGGDNEEYWKPYATFILNSEGYLTEMKGRFNEKPEDELHPYIVQLLMYDDIKGIMGGGYLPENNFAMSDLDPEISEQLIDKKPMLLGLEATYKKMGSSPEFMKLLDMFIDAMDLRLTVRSYKTSKNGYTTLYLDGYNSVKQFAQYHHVEELDQYQLIYEKIDTFTSDKFNEMEINPYTQYEDKDNLAFDVIERMETKYIIEILTDMGHNIDRLTRQDIQDAASYMLLNRGRYSELYLKAISNSIIKTEINDKDFIEYKKMIMNDMKTILENLQMESQHVYLNVTEKDDDLEIGVVMGLDDLIGILTYGNDQEDYEYYNEMIILQEYSPGDVNEYSTQILHDFKKEFGPEPGYSLDGALEIYKGLFNGVDINVEYDVRRAVKNFSELMSNELRESIQQQHLDRIKMLVNMK